MFVAAQLDNAANLGRFGFIQHALRAFDELPESRAGHAPGQFHPVGLSDDENAFLVEVGHGTVEPYDALAHEVLLGGLGAPSFATNISRAGEGKGSINGALGVRA